MKNKKLWWLTLLPIYMAITSRMSGGGLGAPWLAKYNMSWLPEVFFTIPFGVVGGYYAELIFNNNWITYGYGMFAFVWSYLWMQTGHAAALPWDVIEKQAKMARDNTLTPVVKFLCHLFKVKYTTTNTKGEPAYTEAYSWMFMSLKGFLIGLSCGAFMNALFWPLGYEAGSHLKGKTGPVDPHAFAEGFAGFGAALSIIITLLIVITIRSFQQWL